jgi:hypothetical protein
VVLLSLTPIERFLNQNPQKIALPHLTAQRIEPILRAQSSAEVKCFIEDAWLGHLPMHTDTAFSHPVLNHVVDE